MYNEIMNIFNQFYRGIFVFFLVFSTYTLADVELNNNTKELQLLPFTTIYIDETQQDTINDILDDKQKHFRKNSKSVLGFGYSPDFNVWIKVTLHNSSTKKLERIIEYNNPLTTHIEFYSPDLDFKPQYGGIFHEKSNVKSLNSVFSISLNPNEKKTYYFKTSSKITTLIVELKLWDIEQFYNKEISHQIILALFFGAMFILGIYNLFIYFFTKDISYLFYVAYIMGLIFHQLVYVGISSTYLLNAEQTKTLIGFASVLVAIPIFALGLFTKSFLNTEQYKTHNQILIVLLTFIPFVALLFVLTEGYSQYRNFLPIALLIYLFYLTIFAALKKNRQAYFILFGWFVFAFSATLMYLSSLGVFSIHQHFPYIIEVSFLLEAVIFSIALANRINSLQQEKNEANQKLITQKKEETKRLEKTVKEKTQSLTDAVAEKDVLLKELNHRVKNNMQMIISLIRLQSYDISDQKLQSYLKTIQNRIAAMSHLHELLYMQENLHQIQTNSYFQIVIDELQQSYSREIPINLNVTIDLETEEAIYCGLILNELVTNSIKYAFEEENDTGLIEINLYKKGEKVYLEVKDNGCGYDKEKRDNSLGLTLVETLAVQQLDGEYTIDSSNGTDTVICWNNNGKD